MLIQFLLIIFGYLALVDSVRRVKPTCKFEVDTTHFIEIWSVGNLLLSSTEDTQKETTYVEVREGHYFTRECKVGNQKVNDNFQCCYGQTVRTSNGCQQLKVLSCDNQAKLQTSIYRNGTCYNNYTNIDITLSEGDYSYTLMSICHNEGVSETLFVKSHIRGADLDEVEVITRPSFKEAGFYPDISASECYTQEAEFETIAELLGSEELAGEYIQPEIQLYLARGHMSPNADGIEAYERMATFYYVNAVPQWQWINGGNWNRLEMKTRNIAEVRKSNLTIYTGAFGISTLDDVNGNPVEIWLGRTNAGHLVKKIPVPHLLWKVIHDEKKGDAVVVIMINNPWATVRPEDILCADVCSQLLWVDWDLGDVTLGYTYCCDVTSFAKAVPYAPQLGALPLLKQALRNLSTAPM